MPRQSRRWHLAGLPRTSTCWSGRATWQGAHLYVEAMRRATDLIPNSAWVEGGDLTCNGDMIHFNTRSVRTLGQRYAAACLRLVR